MRMGDLHTTAENFWTEINERYEQLRHDQTRPLLPPSEVFLTTDQMFGMMNNSRKLQFIKSHFQTNRQI